MCFWGLYVGHDWVQSNFLEDWAKARGHAFLRFDYAAHGQSEGLFTEHSVAEWAEDAAAVIAAQTSGDLILIGSSMGGWISLNLGRDMGDRLRGLILIAAAPDFTEDSMLASFTGANKRSRNRASPTSRLIMAILSHFKSSANGQPPRLCYARSAGFWMPRSHGAGNIRQCRIT